MEQLKVKTLLGPGKQRQQKKYDQTIPFFPYEADWTDYKFTLTYILTDNVVCTGQKKSISGAL